MDTNNRVTLLKAGQKVKGNLVLGVEIPNNSGVRWLLTSFHSIRCGGDALATVVATFIDVSDQKKKQAILKQQFNALQATRDGMAIFSKNARVIYSNE